MRVHWITLDPSSERGRRFARGCEALGMESEPMVAVRGDTSNLVVTDEMRRRLTKSELGCMSSHLRMLDAAAASGDEWFFICEDDADLAGWIEGWTVEQMLAAQENQNADMVKFHMRPSDLFGNLDAVYGSSTGGYASNGSGRPRFIAHEPLDNIAYAVRPEAAKRLAGTHKTGDRWSVPGGVPVDVWFQRLARGGELRIMAAPLVGEAHGLDSSLTGSKIVLRYRKAADVAVHRTTRHPTTSRALFAARLAGETAYEFRGEIALGLAAASAIGALVYLIMRRRGPRSPTVV